MQFRGKTIPNLTSSFVCVENSGNDVINMGDIPTSDPIRVEVEKGFEILDLTVFSMKTESNLLAFEQKDNALNSIPLTFEYMGPGDHCLAVVLHTGERLHLRGKIKDGSLSEIEFSQLRRLTFISRAQIIASIIVAIALVLYVLFSKEMNVDFVLTGAITFLIMAIAAFALEMSLNKKRMVVFKADILPRYAQEIFTKPQTQADSIAS
jgi:hypothetical protein